MTLYLILAGRVSEMSNDRLCRLIQSVFVSGAANAYADRPLSVRRIVQSVTSVSLRKQLAFELNVGLTFARLRSLAKWIVIVWVVVFWRLGYLSLLDPDEAHLRAVDSRDVARTELALRFSSTSAG